MSQIKRAMLVDSINKGRIMELGIKGNVSVSGVNGSGKTTILKVIPLFYGARPSTISAKTGDVLRSFSDFYLPRPSSFVVFEYEKANRLCCMVAYSNSNELGKTGKVVYHLVDAPYDESWFVESTPGKKELVVNSDFRRRLEVKGIFCSQKMGVNQYKSIIQSGLKSRVGTLKDQRILNDLRSRFSIAPSNIELSNIEEITSGVLNRIPSLDSIKEILQTILANKDNIDNSNLSLSIKEEEISKWIDGYSIIKNIKTQEGNIEDLNDCREKTEQSLMALSILKSLCISRHDLVSSENLQAEKAFGEANIGVENNQAALEVTQEEQRQEKNEHQKALDVKENELLSLVNQKELFESKDIPKQKSIASQIETRKEMLAASEATLDELHAGIEDLVVYFEQLKKALEIEKSQSVNQHQKEVGLVSDRSSKLIEASRRERDSKIEILENNQHLRRNKLMTDLTKASERVAHLKGVIQNVINSPEMLSDLKDKQEEINDVQSDLKIENKELQGKHDDFNKSKRDLDTALEDLRLLNGRIESLNLEYGRIQSLYAPEKGSVLAFLRDNEIKDWESTIAKVIDPKLLSNKSLNPQLDDNGSNGIFGITFDLNSIEAPEFSSLDKLNEKLESLNDQKELLNKERDELNLLIKKLTKIKSDSEQAVKHKKHSVSIVESLLESAIAELDELKIRAELELNTIKESLSKELLSSEEIRKSAQVAQQNFEQQGKEERNSINAMLKENLASIEQKTKNNIDILIVAQKTKESEFEQKGLDIETEKEKSIKEKGLDVSHIQQAKATVAKNLQLKNECESAASLIERYDLFMSELWIQNDSLSAEIKKLRFDKNAMEVEYEARITSIQETIDNLKVVRREASYKKSKFSDELRIFNTLKGTLEKYPLPEKAPELTSIHVGTYLQEETDKRINDIEVVHLIALRKYKTISKMFLSFPGTEPNEYYKTAEREADSQKIDCKMELPKWYYIAERLHHFINIEVINQVALLNAATKNNCLDVSNFAASLIDCHRKIGELGRQLTKHAGKIVNDFEFKAINSLEIIVNSKMDKLDYWTNIHAFQKEYNQWIALGDNETPPESLLSQLDVLKPIVKNTGLNVSIKESFSLEISVIDQGDHKVARNDREIGELSSRGLTYLIILLIYTSLMNLLRGNHETNICWAIDELKDLDRSNAKEIVNLLNSNNITMAAAYPDADPDLLEDYENAYEMKPGRILCNYNPDSINKDKDEVDNIISQIQDKESINA